MSYFCSDLISYSMMALNLFESLALLTRPKEYWGIKCRVLKEERRRSAVESPLVMILDII